MKTFDVPSSTHLKIVKATPHKETHGKALVQAISLRLEWRPMDNAALNMIAEGLQDSLLWIPPEQAAQDNVDGVNPVKKWRRCPGMKMPVGIPTASFTGYGLVIEHGIDEKTELELYKCNLDKFEAEVDGNGFAVIRWSLNSNKEITPELVDALCGLEGLSIVVKELTLPSTEETIDGSVEAFEKDHPLLDAADAFAENEEAGLNSDPKPARTPKKSNVNRPSLKVQGEDQIPF